MVNHSPSMPPLPPSSQEREHRRAVRIATHTLGMKCLALFDRLAAKHGVTPDQAMLACARGEAL